MQILRTMLCLVLWLTQASVYVHASSAFDEDPLRCKTTGQKSPLMSAFTERTNPLWRWYFGQQKGVTFVFENGIQVTYGTLFVAYQSKAELTKDNLYAPFGDTPCDSYLGPLKMEFKKPEPSYSYGIIPNPLKSFMGLVPQEDGVIDTTMTLDSFRKELYKLGRIKSEILNEDRLDQRFPQEFLVYYNMLRLRYDENGITHSEPIVIEGSWTKDICKIPLVLSKTVKQRDPSTWQEVEVNRWEPTTWAEKDPLGLSKRLEASGSLISIEPSE
jgi:hypothetical protein